MKYFYDDALAVLWMQDKFGLKIDETKCVQEPEEEGKLRAVNPGPWYVHEDSLHLFKPKAGDFIYEGQIASPSSNVDVLFYLVPKEGDKLSPKAKITYRDGISFIWPKVEE